jgi:hypothetical protein
VSEDAVAAASTAAAAAAPIVRRQAPFGMVAVARKPLDPSAKPGQRTPSAAPAGAAATSSASGGEPKAWLSQ